MAQPLLAAQGLSPQRRLEAPDIHKLGKEAER